MLKHVQKMLKIRTTAAYMTRNSPYKQLWELPTGLQKGTGVCPAALSLCCFGLLRVLVLGVRAEQGGCYPWGSVLVICLLFVRKSTKNSLS